MADQAWPVHTAIKVEDDGATLYMGKLIGQIMPVPGHTYNDGKDQFYTNTFGGLFYSAKGAAYDLATLHVRGQRPANATRRKATSKHGT